jgi:GNAT superfamily N-acetyltransferase
MAVPVRPFADADAAAVAAILDSTYGHDARLRALHEGSHGPALESPFRRTLVAQFDGDIVGVGTFLESTRHPRHTWLGLEVAPLFRRRRIATTLLAELRGMAKRPFVTRGLFAERGAIGFLDHHRFVLLNRCWEGRFDPRAISERLPDVHVDEPPSLDEAAEFFERWYQATHWFSPPEPLSLERARKLFCGDSLVRESLVGVRKDDRLIGAAGLVQPPAYDLGDELYLVWIGTLGSNGEAATTLVAACVQFALEAGKMLRFELDESNVSIWRTLNELGLLGAPEFGIFAKETKAD